MFHSFDNGAFFALLQVILIDIVLAGDNAVVIGMAAARLPRAMRHKVIFWGLAAAVVLRVFLATVTVELFAFIPLRVVGGILLLWVAWRLYRDVRHANATAAGGNGHEENCEAKVAAMGGGEIVMRRAIMQITIADISMSLDNVLAVAGAAIHHIWVLAVGLDAVDRADGRSRRTSSPSCSTAIPGSAMPASSSCSMSRWR